MPPAATEAEAIRRCLPGGPGERRDCLFRLARTLKGLPHLADADAEELGPAVEAWFALAAPVVRTKDFGASWKDFTDLWAVVRSPMGSGFEEAVRAALDGPPPPEAAAFADLPTKRLTAVCAALQRHAGRGPFFLSCRTAARVAGFTNQMTASRRVKEFVRRGLLEVVEAGRPGRTRRKAGRYRWLGRAAVVEGGEPPVQSPARESAVTASASTLQWAAGKATAGESAPARPVQPRPALGVADEPSPWEDLGGCRPASRPPVPLGGTVTANPAR